MPLLENDVLVRGYFDTIKDKYPNLTKDQIEAIIKHPFRYIKSQLEKPSMPTVLIKYFGKFTVFPGKLRTLIKENDTKFRFNQISLEVYKERNETYSKKLKELIDDTKGTEDTMEENS